MSMVNNAPFLTGEFKSKFLKPLIYGVLLISVLYLCIYYFSLKWWHTIIFLCLLNAGFQLYAHKFTWKGYLKNCLVISLLLTTLHVLALYGWIGWVLAIILITGWYFYSRWDRYMMAKHYCERYIFGEELYKFRERGEKPPKIHIKF